MFEALDLTLHLTAIYSQLSAARAVLVSGLVALLAAAAHCILGTTAGAGPLTLTLPALSSLTQTQILYLTAGGLSTDTVLFIYYLHIYTRPRPGGCGRAGRPGGGLLRAGGWGRGRGRGQWRVRLQRPGQGGTLVCAGFMSFYVR